jgi:TonB family protein
MSLVQKSSTLLTLLLVPIAVQAQAVSVADKRLHSFCSSATIPVRAGVVDPTMLVDRRAFKAARPTVLLGQKLEYTSRRLALEGTLLLGVVTTEEGRATFVQVVEPSEHDALNVEAVSIFRTGRYSPATLNGKATSACAVWKVTFRVLGGA